MNTYVLGAGFSVFAKMPLISNMFKEIINFKNSYNDIYDYDILEKAYKRLYNESINSNTKKSYEDFISQIDVLKNFEFNEEEETGFFENGFWSQALKSSMYIITELFEKIEREQNNEQFNFYNGFIENLNNDDVIISFNWDTLIENALMRNNIPFSYRPNEKNKLPLLKLHGSLSWIDLPKDIKPKIDNIYEAIDGRTTLLYTNDCRYVKPKIGLDNFSFIITPTIMKNPLRNVAMRNIWTKAYNSLRDSNKIYIIGCSFSGVDFHAKGLMKSAIYENMDKEKNDVVVINPGENLKNIYDEMLGDNYIFKKEKFNPENISPI